MSQGIYREERVNLKTTELRLDNIETGYYCQKTSVSLVPAATCKNLFINKQTGLLQSSVLTTGLPLLSSLDGMLKIAGFDPVGKIQYLLFLFFL